MALLRNKILRRFLYVALSTLVLLVALRILDQRLNPSYWASAADELKVMGCAEVPVTLLPESAVLELRHFDGLRALVGRPPRYSVPQELIVVPGPEPHREDVDRLRNRYRQSESIGSPELGMLRLSSPKGRRTR